MTAGGTNFCGTSTGPGPITPCGRISRKEGNGVCAGEQAICVSQEVWVGCPQAHTSSLSLQARRDGSWNAWFSRTSAEGW